MINRIISLKLFVISFLLISQSALCQNIKQEKMELLNFMVGEWVGNSKTYEDGIITKQVSAFEKISYDLDSSIIVLELNSESLLLHTIIYYDEKDSTYYYYPFSKNGVGRAPAIYENGKLIVQSNENRRYIFQRTSDGGFREYGEKRINGKWVKYFQDDFKDTQ